MMKPVMGGDAAEWERRLAAETGPFVSSDHEHVSDTNRVLYSRMECMILSQCLMTMRNS